MPSAVNSVGEQLLGNTINSVLLCAKAAKAKASVKLLGENNYLFDFFNRTNEH